MRQAMVLAKELDKPIVAHCEDESLLTKGWCVHDGAYAKAHGLTGNNPESEWRQVERDLQLVRETGCRYHVCHISTKESVALIRQAKAEGLPVTCETGPHYLVLCDEDLQDDGRFQHESPHPLRDGPGRPAGGSAGRHHRLHRHRPRPPQRRGKIRRPAGQRSTGIVGLECAFPVLYTQLVQTGVVPAGAAAGPTDASGPAGSSACPAVRSPRAQPADLTVLDLDDPHVIECRRLPLSGPRHPLRRLERFRRQSI